jgi:hypothetical protein
MIEALPSDRADDALNVSPLPGGSWRREKDIHAAYDNHANGYIIKPGTSEGLADIVKTIELFWIAIAQLPKVTRSHVQ